MKVINTKSSWFKESDLRLDASYHLSDGPLTKLKLKASPFEVSTLSQETKEIFKGNIFKRAYVSIASHGFPFMTASDMMKTDIFSGKYVSRKYTEISNLLFEKGWTLVSRSGTLGSTAYTNEDYEGVVGTDDLIRIVPNGINIKRGYLYAYLTSKYGYGLLTQSSYGGVVKHIEPHHIENLPIPILLDTKQQEIHNLIEEASELRVKGNNLLKEATAILESKLPSLKSKNIYRAKISKRFAHNFRLEATYLADSIDLFYLEAKKTGAILKSINEISEEVFTPGIFKRIRTNTTEYGIPYLSGSDLLSQMPQFDRFLSKKMKNIEDYVLKDGWLAIQDAGTIGYISLITKYLDGVTATNNLIRIKPNVELNHNYYIFCFFKTSIGQKLIKSLEYGSVQKHIDNHQISAFQIPIYDDAFEQVSEKIKIMHEKLSNACFLEKDAISIVEKEIESWQES